MIKEDRRKVNRRVESFVEVERKVLTVEEVAKELRISRNLAYRQVREGKIYSIKCGDRYLIPRRALEELLDGQRRWGGNGSGDGNGGGGVASAGRLPLDVKPAEQVTEGLRSVA